jgi:two-component system, cell cycle sensor histidine kinase and response regulator CckA
MNLEKMTREELVAYANDLEKRLAESNDFTAGEAEKALRESEEKYRLIFLKENDSIVLTDSETLEFLDVNESAERLWGYTKEELLKMKASDVSAEPESSFQTLAKGSEASGIIVPLRWHRKKDGTLFPVEISAGPFTWNGRKVVCSIIRDISVRYASEFALRTSKIFLQSTLDALSAHIAILDENGFILEVNEPWRRFARENGANLNQDGIGINYLEVCDSAEGDWSEGAQAVGKLLRELINGSSEAFQWEYPCHSQSEKRWFVLHASCFRMEREVRVVVAHENITARKLAEEALQASESKYRRLHETIWDAVGIVDMSGRIQETNQAFQTMIGYSEDELLQLTYEDLTPEKWHTFESDIVKNQVLVRGYSDIYFKEYRKKDGTVFPIELRTFLLRDETGRPSAMWAIVRDISERKKAEEAVELANRDWERTFNTLSDLIMVLDKNHRIIHANNAMTEALGMTEKEAKGKRCYELVHGERKPPAFCPHSRLIKDGEEHHEQIVEPHLGGIYDVRVSPLKDPKGKIQGSVHVVRDISERIRAEAVLRESEKRFRSLFENMLEGYCYCEIIFENGEPNDFKYLDVNDAFEKLTGLKDVVGKKASEVISNFKEDGSELLEILARVAMSGEPEKFETHVSSLGKWFSSSVYSPKQGYFVSMFDNITDRKLAEKQVKLNEARLQSLYNISQFSTESIQALLDVVLHEAIKLTESKVGYIYYYDESKKLFELNTWSKEVMQQCEVAEPKTTYELEKTGIWGEAVRQRQPIIVNDFKSENPLKKGYPEGHVELYNFMTTPVFSEDKIVAVVGVANKKSDYDESDVRQISLLMDSVWKITEAKRIDAVRRRLVTAVEQAVEGIVITDTTGNIEYVNPSYERITGYLSHEVIGQKPTMLRSEEGNSSIRQEIIETLGRGERWSGHLVKRRKDGNSYEEDVTVTPVLDPNGKVVNFVIVKRDVTKEAGLQRQLLQAQKMEAIGTLAGGVAHDFNNILQVTLGYSELLLADRTDENPDYDDLQRIHKAARSGAELVKSLLTFSRKVETSLVPLSLNQQVTQIEKLLKRTIPKMINIRLELSGDLTAINADPTQIEQILMNLAVNARDAMPDGGTLTIKTRDVELNQEDLLLNAGVQPGNYVLLSVSDTGQGMDKDTLQHMFEPFFTTKELGRGTGLGLAIVYGIVKNHGGHIGCNSKPGHGTTFEMYFPSSEEYAEPDDESSDEVQAMGTETVLLVDDEDFVRELGSRILKAHGYTVLSASEGEEALALYGKEKDRIALVILDLIMPTMGGKDCLKEILRVDPNARILIASGYSGDISIKECFDLGAKGFVAKPFRIKELLRQARRALNGS